MTSLPLRILLAVLFAVPCASAGEGLVFRRDVMAALSKAGCNVGGCHGNGQGKGGLKLSLWGQDPDLDWVALAQDQAGRRINLVDPDRSLVLLKATGQLAHEGGRRFGVESPEYEVLRDWIAQGAEESGQDVRVEGLEVITEKAVVIEPEDAVRLSVRARFSDGSERDVTRMAVFEPNNLRAKVSVDGEVRRESFGETTVLVRYLNQQKPVTINFVPERRGFVWTNPPVNNFVDEHVFRKLQTLRIQPSELASDEVFFRRAYLDLLGVVPTGESARAFAMDSDPEKRVKLVDRLLEREEFADFWALKWADLLRIEERQLDPTGMKVFHGWIRAAIQEKKPMDQFARELVAARGSTYENPPANWYRANRDPVQRAENTARVFLGTQLNCAQCHNHPFERWTQDDYYDWAALFARVDYEIKENKQTDKNDKNEFKGDQIVRLKAEGKFINPRHGQPAVMRFLGGEIPRIEEGRDELEALADWISRSPLFVNMQVNRVWFHLFGRGLVDPVDDFRVSSPAAHPELLEALSNEFVDSGYDLRQLIRTIMRSRVYQLSSEPNETNAGDEQFFSRAQIRRLSAEQVIDSLSKALDVPLKIDGFPKGTRLAQVPEGRKHYKPLRSEVDRFAATFGKPPRLVASECERSDEVAMPQVFQLMSGTLVQEMLASDNGRVKRWAEAEGSTWIEEMSWSLLSRAPASAETAAFSAYVEAAEVRRRAIEDVAWALINAKEFVFRR